MIKKAENGVWCDYCKMRWGQHKGIWHTKAVRQAIITIHSQTKKAKGSKRSYCGECVEMMERWSDGTIWPLADQVEAALKAESEQLEIGSK